MNLTEEQVLEWEKEVDRQHQFVLDQGWKWNGEIGLWEDPEGETHPYINGYDQVIMLILRDKGWKRLTEISHSGNKDCKFHKVEKWARYQSPATKRIYTYLDAQYVVEQGWDESHYPDKCCGATKHLNRLAGENFAGDVIETWHHRRDGEQVYQLWDGDIVHECPGATRACAGKRPEAGRVGFQGA